MNVTDIVTKLEGSDTYSQFIEDNPSYYLVHLFNMEENGWDDWQLGYYSEEEDSIVAFHLRDTIEQAPEDDVLKEDGSVEPLEPDTVSVNPEDAVSKVTNYQEKHYPDEYVTKTILILQTEDDTPVYNITLVTQSFELINCTVNAQTGEIEDETKESILKLGKPM